MECSILAETINEIDFGVFFVFCLFYQALKKKLIKKVRRLRSGTISNDFFYHRRY